MLTSLSSSTISFGNSATYSLPKTTPQITHENFNTVVTALKEHFNAFED